MKIQHMTKTPSSYYGGESEAEELGEYDIDRLKRQGVQEAYYWYLSGSYEGSGYMVFKKADKWGEHDMGHCSCYGPLGDDGDLVAKYDSPREILELATNDYRAYVEPLVLMAEKAAKKPRKK